VPSLTDYIQPWVLEQLQELFSQAAGASMRILGSDDPVPSGQSQAAVAVGEDIVARVVISRPGVPGEDKSAATDVIEPQRFADLAGEVLSRLAGQQEQLRSRIEELAALYRLTAEFTSRRDLQGVLDMVAQTVVEVLGAKSCAIRLINEDRSELVIKAVTNLSRKYLEKGPILLSASKIDQVVLERLKPVYIADLRTDPRVLYPNEACEEGIVSGLCCPMVYRGRPEGVLRVYTGRIHEFDWFEVSLAEAIAAEAAAAIVNARLYAEAVRSANMQRQLKMAGTVQRRMIPAWAPEMPRLDIGAVYVPCFELGGDFYDFIRLGEHNLGISVCDVVGKGVRASLLMASVRASLRAHASNVYELSEVVRRVNQEVCADTGPADFATLFYGVIDTADRRFTYVNAGHMPPLLIRDGQFSHLAPGGGILGLDDEAQWRHENFLLQPGDVVLCYTDGLTDAMNFGDEPFGRSRVEAAVLDAIQLGRDADGIVKHVLWEMRRFAGLQTRFDDLTVVAVRAL